MNLQFDEHPFLGVRQTGSSSYVGILPSLKQTHREALAQSREEKKATEQGWAHRVYAELLHADVLPDDLAQTVIDAVRGHGGTAIGVVANIGPANESSRDQLGFISYGYAQQLLRSDRIEEYLLFLHSHRYHSHTPGTWVAGEVSGITGDLPLFCIPAQLTIPKLVRWALVYEASDADTLYLGRAVARDWLAAGQTVSIAGAPTRWGAVDFSLRAADAVVAGEVAFTSQTLPKEVRLRLRVPKGKAIASARLNGRKVEVQGEEIVFAPSSGRIAFEAKLKRV